MRGLSFRKCVCKCVAKTFPPTLCHHRHAFMSARCNTCFSVSIRNSIPMAYHVHLASSYTTHTLILSLLSTQYTISLLVFPSLSFSRCFLTACAAMGWAQTRYCRLGLNIPHAQTRCKQTSTHMSLLDCNRVAACLP